MLALGRVLLVPQVLGGLDPHALGRGVGDTFVMAVRDASMPSRKGGRLGVEPDEPSVKSPAYAPVKSVRAVVVAVPRAVSVSPRRRRAAASSLMASAAASSNSTSGGAGSVRHRHIIAGTACPYRSGRPDAGAMSAGGRVP